MSKRAEKVYLEIWPRAPLDEVQADIDLIEAALTAAVREEREKWAKAAREVLDALTCPDCEGLGILGGGRAVEPGIKPIACETCGGDEDSRGSGYVLSGDNVDEKLNALAANCTECIRRKAKLPPEAP